MVKNMVVFGIAVLVMISLYLLNGVALMLLWEWFMVPTFGLPAISMMQAIGIGIIVSIMTMQHIPRNEDEKIEMFKFSFLTPVLATAIGWVVHMLM